MFTMIAFGVGVYAGSLIERQDGDNFITKVRNFFAGLHF